MTIAVIICLMLPFGALAEGGASAFHLDGYVAVQGVGNQGDGQLRTGAGGGMSGRARVGGVWSIWDFGGDRGPGSEGLAVSVWPFSLWPILGMTWGAEAAMDVEVQHRPYLEGGASGVLPVFVRGSSEATLRTGVLNLTHRGSHGNPIPLQSRFWRPTTGLLVVGYGVEFPGLLRLQSTSREFVFQHFEVRIDEILYRSVDDRRADYLHLGRDVSISSSLVAYRRAREFTPLEVSVISAEVDNYAVPLRSADGSWAEDSSHSILIEFVDIRGISTNDGASAMDFSLGLSWLEPMQRRTAIDEADPQMSMGFHGWLGFHRRHQSISDARYGIGIGTFHRLAPSGLAVDYGGQLRGQLEASPGENWLADVHATGIVARRAQTSHLADMSTAAPVGTMQWMGRLEASASRPLRGGLRLQLKSWVEHTDRDDPGREISALRHDEMSMHFGFEAAIARRIF